MGKQRDIDRGHRSRRTNAWLQVLWSVIGAITTYAMIMIAAMNKPDGLRGQRTEMAWFDVREHDQKLNLIIIGIFGVAVGVLIWFHGRLRLPLPLLLGAGIAVAAALVVVLTA